MRRRVMALLCGLLAITPVRAEPTPAEKLVQAAREQVGITVVYDPAYVVLKFPAGDVPADRGVCTDVVIRALRRALDLDLQRLVNEDMRANFSRYPKNWASPGRTETLITAGFRISRRGSSGTANRSRFRTIRPTTARATS